MNIGRTECLQHMKVPYCDVRIKQTTSGKSGKDRLSSLIKSTFESHKFMSYICGAAQQFAEARELFQVPARNLDNTVVERWLETCRSFLRDCVFDLVERDAQPEFGSDEGEGVTCRFRCECGGAGETGVDLPQT